LWTGFCGWSVTIYQTGRDVRIHFIVGLTNPERVAAWIMQVLDLTEAPEGDGYAISRAQSMEIHHHWMMNIPDQAGRWST
jgi:hypothetical protein